MVAGYYIMSYSGSWVLLLRYELRCMVAGYYIMSFFKNGNQNSKLTLSSTVVTLFVRLVMMSEAVDISSALIASDD